MIKIYQIKCPSKARMPHILLDSQQLGRDVSEKDTNDARSGSITDAGNFNVTLAAMAGV